MQVIVTCVNVDVLECVLRLFQVHLLQYFWAKYVFTPLHVIVL